MSKRLDYHKMFQRVLLVDEDAAELLLSKKGRKSISTDFNKRRRLEDCFVFGDSPQGHEYWWNIYRKSL